MKKTLAALVTFTIGVLAFNFWKIESAVTIMNLSPERKIVETAPVQAKLFQIDDAPVEKKEVEKSESLKSFFDSFKAAEYDEWEYQGYSGWFIADDFTGMPEVWTILLRRDDENSKKGKLVWSAMILTQNADGSPNDDDNFRSVSIKTKGSNLSFKTKKIHGIEYKFDGKFFKNGKSFSNEEKVLKGTLQKFVRGKKTAELTADFAYHEPVCFH